MGLVTRCPKCESEYEVTADQLKLHDGLVRCGHCSHVFDGFACLKDALPTLTRKVAIPVPSPAAAPSSTPVLSVSAESTLPPTIAASPARPVTIESVQPSGQATASAATSTGASMPAPAHPSSAQGLPAQDGPFVPSVDRQPASRFFTPGRQEPGLGLTASSTAVDSSAADQGDVIEPVLGSMGGAYAGGSQREPTLGNLVQPTQTRGAQVKAEPTVRLIGESRVKGDDPSAFGRTVPEFLENVDQEPESSSMMWLVGAIVLALALIAQSLVVFRNDIVAAAPSLRPLLVQMCKPISCDVSYVRQIERIFIVGSSLQQAPDKAATTNQRAYVLRLTLQNRSAYPQPWPALLLTLTDASGTAVIKKALLPSTFLPPDLLDGPMAPRQEAGLDIPLIVEGMNISGYELERFFP